MEHINKIESGKISDKYYNECKKYLTMYVNKPKEILWYFIDQKKYLLYGNSKETLEKIYNGTKYDDEDTREVAKTIHFLIKKYDKNIDFKIEKILIPNVIGFYVLELIGDVGSFVKNLSYKLN